MYETRSFEEATQILLDLTLCKNLYNNKYNESINLILNHFLILDSLSDNLYDDFNDEIIWSLKNNLAVSYYNSRLSSPSYINTDLTPTLENYIINE